MTRWIKRLFGRGDDTPGDDIDCHAVAELLQQYLDGHIDEHRARLISEHLEVCRMCGLEAEAYERIKATLARHQPVVPSDSLERLREFGEQLAHGEGTHAT